MTALSGRPGGGLDPPHEAPRPCWKTLLGPRPATDASAFLEQTPPPDGRDPRDGRAAGASRHAIGALVASGLVEREHCGPALRLLHIGRFECLERDTSFPARKREMALEGGT
jgi:hypothetical protein